MGPLLGLIACGSPDPGWRVALEADPETALAACPDAECQLGVVRAHGRVSPEGCAQVGEGPFHFECWFLIAEQRAEAGEDAAAAEACDHTGPFRKSCLQHGWDRASERAMRMSPGAPGPEVEALLDQAASAYGGQLADPSTEIWNAFWWAWWEREGPVDLERCPDERCVAASRVAVMRRAFRAGCEGEHVDLCVEGSCAGADEGRAIACSPGLARPWSPTFR